MRAIKKITAFLLAMVMVLSLAPSVFAAEEPKITVAVDKTSVKAGETVTFTYESTAAVAEMTNLDVCLAYDGDVFEYVSVDTEDSVWFENPRVRSRYTLLGYPMFRLSEDKDDEEDVDAGKMFSVTFRALETITDVKEASFYNHDSLTVWEYEWEEHKAVDGYFDHSKDDPIYVVVTPKGTEPIATPTGYSVSMGADQTVAADQKVLIPVTVNSSRATVTGFNAYDMTFTYNPAALTLNTASDAAANLTVEDNNGTVRVRRYGATQALGEALALDFTAIKAASSTVTLTAAKFDIDANSINFDAPNATITDADTTVKGLWNVSLPDGFLSTAANGSTLVENGGDFTFKTTDTHYEYYLNITTNGATNIVKMDNATYTIKNVTDNVTVTVDNKIGKTYTINYVVVDNTTTENKATVADLVEYTGTTVQYPNDYKFTVKFPGTGYVVRVGIEPNKNKRDYVRQENGDYVYTLLGSSLTGDENNEITITLTKQENTSQHKIEVVGSGSDAFSENNALTFYSGENYTFTLNKNDTYYDYSVLVYYWQQNIGGNGGKNIRMEYKDNGDGTYTIIDMPYADVTISINKMAKAIDPDAVEVSTYVELDNKTVFKVVVQGSHELLNRDQTTYSYTWFTYDGQKMYCNPRYTKFAGNGSSSSVYLVMVDKGETLTKEDAMAKLGIVTSTKQENLDQLLEVGSDVNEDGIGGVGINRRDVNDVQLIYDLYNGLYDSFETVSMRKFLKADVNYDGVLDSQDAVKLAGELLAD